MEHKIKKVLNNIKEKVFWKKREKEEFNICLWIYLKRDLNKSKYWKLVNTNDFNEDLFKWLKVIDYKFNLLDWQYDPTIYILKEWNIKFEYFWKVNKQVRL